MCDLILPFKTCGIFLSFYSTTLFLVIVTVTFSFSSLFRGNSVLATYSLGLRDNAFFVGICFFVSILRHYLWGHCAGKFRKKFSCFGGKGAGFGIFPKKIFNLKGVWFFEAFSGLKISKRYVSGLFRTNGMMPKNGALAPVLSHIGVLLFLKIHFDHFKCLKN